MSSVGNGNGNGTCYTGMGRMGMKKPFPQMSALKHDDDDDDDYECSVLSRHLPGGVNHRTKGDTSALTPKHTPSAMVIGDTSDKCWSSRHCRI